MSKRAERRHHYQRLKKKRENYWGGEPNCLGAVVATPQICSNPYCCGNPRRIRGRNVLTVQERRNEQANW